MKLDIDQLQLTLGGLSFNYNASISGGIFGVFGVSGSGKSTLMRLICGIERAQQGRIVFNDSVLFDSQQRVHVPPHLRHIGVVFQEHHLFPHLTAEQNLRFGQKYAPRTHISLNDVVTLLDLSSLLQKKPAHLSGGERQRVAIGRALLQGPKLLLLDEPFSNLDRDRRRQIISYLLKIHHRFDIPLLIISHDLEDILKLTRALIIIEDRSIAAVGDYLHIAANGDAPHLISPKNFINTVELIHQRYLPKQRLNHFGLTPESAPLIVTNSSYFNDLQTGGNKVRLAIAPDDIALSRDTCSHISMQNQLRGKVTHILHMNDSFFVTVDCGIELISEIAPGALYQLDVKPGCELICLFKAKAVEVTHIFDAD
ncbi:MAG: molybdenum ABC transporter ATP-binding protein [Deltaproteobacteria bacterium]|nr:molybdenum ABC transporter ATP-binding protein [Deltaproteobacteria bacterium]